jgi:hypothetical protein
VVERVQAEVVDEVRLQGQLESQGPGTDVMILKIFSPKVSVKILAFFERTTVSFCKNDHNISF